MMIWLLTFLLIALFVIKFMREAEREKAEREKWEDIRRQREADERQREADEERKAAELAQKLLQQEVIDAEQYKTIVEDGWAPSLIDVLEKGHLTFEHCRAVFKFRGKFDVGLPQHAVTEMP